MCAFQAPTSEQSSVSNEPVVNDFAFSVATPNGSGSQTSNNVLVQTLFDMGIPVNGKNLFPSNIKGLPTWYTIRASKDGYTARRATTEIVVAFNGATVAEDVAALPSGGVCIIREDVAKIAPKRDDITVYIVPVKDLMKEAEVPSAFAKRVENMTYVGAVAQLFDIPLDMIKASLLKNFGGKQKPAAMNFAVIQLAYDYFKDNIEKSDPFRFEKMDLTKGKILITGNEAGALGAVFGGVHVVAWYPITPSTSLVDGIISYKHLRKDPETGKSTIAVVQAEDELAAVGMALGAGWAGARSMTATSGPGISLMSEFTGYGYFAEIPTVIFDIQRVGPSTGLPTRTSQGDLISTYFLSHGDTKHPILLPGSVAECYEFAIKAFDMAERLQTAKKSCKYGFF